ncbi:CBS domain-containing protein [Qipengyuania sediminis]|uniref:CBS domain-containing protein n=1 Tax=Qipengyuania sediminis TaxID=1532023 RepID=UPI00105AA50B|nr:CBS domain-containing protein [Qipengyuania sediminis]
MQIAQLLKGRTSGDIVRCSPHTLLGDAVRTLAERRIGAMPVVEGSHVLGIVSERDVLYCLASEGAQSLDKPVAEVMTAPVVSVTLTTSCDEALALMTERRFRHVPVLDGGKMCGFLSIGDLVKSRLDEVSHEAAALRDYIRLA